MDLSSIDVAFRLAELMASRLCHDLSGPLNGLGSGFGTSGEPPSLAEEASRAAIARLVLLRAAWGEPGEKLGRADFERLAIGLPRRRIQVDLSGLDDGAVFGSLASRFLLNVMLLCSESLPRGGTLALRGNAARGVVAMIDGPNAAWPEGLTGMIVSPLSILDGLHDISPRNLQLPFTLLMAHATGQRLSLLLGASASPAPPVLIGFAPE